MYESAISATRPRAEGARPIWPAINARLTTWSAIVYQESQPLSYSAANPTCSGSASQWKHR